MAIKLRRFKNQDIKKVHDLHLQALRNVPNLAIQDGPIDADLLDIETSYINNGGDFLILEENSHIIGMGAIRRKGDLTGEIRRMRIDPNHWHKGYGQMLLSHLEEVAKEKGYRQLVLDTTIHQLSAQKLYEKNGYREKGRIQQYGYECILYEKVLE